MARAASEKQLPIGVTDRSPKAKHTAMAEILSPAEGLARFRLQKEAPGTWDLRQLKQDAPQDESQVPPHPARRCPKVSAEDEKRGFVQLKNKRVCIKTGKLSAAIAASTAAIQDLIDVGFSRAEAEDHVFANYGTVAQETLANHKERCAKGGRATGTTADRAAAGQDAYGDDAISGFAKRSKGGSSKSDAVLKSAANARDAFRLKLPPGHVPTAGSQKSCVDPASRLPARPIVPGRSALRVKRAEVATDLRKFETRAKYELDGEDRGGPAYRRLFQSVLYDDCRIAGKKLKKLTIGALVKKAANAQPQDEKTVAGFEATICEFALAVDVYRLALDSEAKPATPAAVDVFVYDALRGPCAGLVCKAKAARANFAAAKCPQRAKGKSGTTAKKPKAK
ncbi:hypothetical protein JL722_8250 [Aureococcus anophagefferens]|nr:hypothetical protein JL722_8250 [Aureococcus anophagefferens]